MGSRWLDFSLVKASSWGHRGEQGWVGEGMLQLGLARPEQDTVELKGGPWGS